MSIFASPARPVIGREQAIADLVRRVRSTRLLTLIGPGGVGKTTLARAVAEALAPTSSSDIVFVDLSPLREPALLLNQIAQALGIVATRDDQLRTQLTAYLRDKQPILLLDNCEQILEAAPQLAALLAEAPGVHVLATSRAAWRIHGEQEYPLAPLPVPPNDSLADIGAAPAAQLLLERARAARSDFALTEANAASIGAICRQLDGLPLALELAAARLRVLAPQDLAARLARSLPLLTGGPRDAPDRQRTLRNTIAWSYDLLAPKAQAQLQQLAVFDGGATVEAIAAVWGAAAVDADMLDGLTNLVEQSLVIGEVQATPERYRLFETVREFAVEQLEARGASVAVRMRHARYYCALAETAEQQLTGPGQAEWMDRLSSEQANLRSALEYLLHPVYGDPGQAVRLGIALARFWWIKKRLIEGRTALERIVTATRTTAQATTASQAALLHWAATMAWGQADYAVAEHYYSEGLALCRALNDPQATARALKGLGALAREQGRAQEARQLFEDALALVRQAGDTWGMTLILSHLGMTLETLGQYDEATAVQTECLTLSYELGDTWSVAYALKDLAYLALHAGDLAEARRQVNEAITIYEQLDDTQGLAYALLVLGDIALCAGDDSEARTQFGRMRTILQEIGDQRGIALADCGLADAALDRGDFATARIHYIACLAQQHEQRNPITYPRGLEGAARLAVAVHEPERGAHLFAAAAAFRAALGIPLPAAQLATCQAAMGQVQRALGAERFAAAWAAGQALSSVEAIALAGRAVPPPQLSADAPLLERRHALTENHGGLTAREREVLALLVRGLSNSAIASELHMSPHTAHSHVRTIFSKLGVTSRAAATRVALEQGLVV